MIDFTLTYEGPIPSGSNAARVVEKQAIRRQFHPQLARWWETGALAATLAEIRKNRTIWDKFIFCRLAADTGFTFVPLVIRDLKLVCSLDILFLRPEGDPLVKNDGDLDNRLKVIFDALRMPHERVEIPNGDQPADNERPYFYCLVEDDSLITGVSVEPINSSRPFQSSPDPSAS